MVSKPFSAGKPTVYLDTSTLSDAFFSCSVESDKREPDYAPLISWIERVAGEANLVLSGNHLLELRDWKSERECRALVTWLDGLPVVWAHSFGTVLMLEDEHWLLRAFGQDPDAVLPFAPSLGSSFDVLSPEASATFLTQRSLWDVVQSLGYRSSRPRNIAVGAASGYRYDQQFGLPAEEHDRIAEWNSTAMLADRAIEASRRLASKGFRLPARSGREVAAALTSVLAAQPRALPLERVMRAFTKGFFAKSRRLEEGSKKAGKQASTTHDAAHLVGAAYCDVFTCDGDVAEWLGDVRVSLGLQPQIRKKGKSKAELVQALTHDWA